MRFMPSFSLVVGVHLGLIIAAFYFAPQIEGIIHQLDLTKAGRRAFFMEHVAAGSCLPSTPRPRSARIVVRPFPINCLHFSFFYNLGGIKAVTGVVPARNFTFGDELTKAKVFLAGAGYHFESLAFDKKGKLYGSSEESIMEIDLEKGTVKANDLPLLTPF